MNYFILTPSRVPTSSPKIKASWALFRDKSRETHSREEPCVLDSAVLLLAVLDSLVKVVACRHSAVTLSGSVHDASTTVLGVVVVVLILGVFEEEVIAGAGGRTDQFGDLVAFNQLKSSTWSHKLGRPVKEQVSMSWARREYSKLYGVKRIRLERSMTGCESEKTYRSHWWQSNILTWREATTTTQFFNVSKRTAPATGPIRKKAICTLVYLKGGSSRFDLHTRPL